MFKNATLALYRKALLSLVALTAAPAFSAQPLPALAVDLHNTSVSGLSSGAFMTSQLFMAHSRLMVGAGIVAGGPYLCAQSWAFQDYLTNATTSCMNPLNAKVGPNTPLLVKRSQKLASQKRIDPLPHLSKTRLYLFSGQADKVVTTAVVDQTQAFFLTLGVPQTAIRYRKDVNAGHAIITANQKDTACSTTTAPFINDCHFTQAQDILSHIYPSLNPAAPSASGQLLAFNQQAFIKNTPNTSMSNTAYVYIPSQCQQGGCGLHVVFHGCLQGAEVIGDRYYAHTGYNPIADTNRLVVLYPQAQPSQQAPFNPQGCWDFWGYSNPNAADQDYFSQNAPQIRAVYAMMQQLAQPLPAQP